MTYLASNDGKTADPSTALAEGKEPVSLPTVFYDVNCRLCRDLAYFMSKIAPRDVMTFLPSSEGSPRSLMVRLSDLVTGSLVELADEDAWKWLLDHHPLLKPLQWLAEKIGLAEVTPRRLMDGAAVLRRMCRNCPKTTRHDSGRSRNRPS